MNGEADRVVALIAGGGLLAALVLSVALGERPADFWRLVLFGLAVGLAYYGVAPRLARTLR